MFWKAASTLVESNAEVSINDNSFLSEKKTKHQPLTSPGHYDHNNNYAPDSLNENWHWTAEKKTNVPLEVN